MNIAGKINLSFSLLIFFALATGFLIVALLTKTLPLFASKSLYFCQQFFSNTMFEIPHSLPNGVVTAAIIISSLGVLSFLAQLTKTKMLLKKLSTQRGQQPHKLTSIIDYLDLTGKVVLVKNKSLFSFCSGIISPKIIITTALVKSLDDKELEAVLLHEKSHLKNLDPLKLLLGKTVSTMFFFLPVFSELHKSMQASNELIADMYTTKAQGGAVILRSALKKIIATPQVNLATVSAVANPDYLEIRFRRLVNPSINIGFHLSITSIFTSLLFVVVSWLILQTPVQAFQMEGMSEPSSFVCAISDSTCHHECSNEIQGGSTTSSSNMFTPVNTLKYDQNYSSYK